MAGAVAAIAASVAGKMVGAFVGSQILGAIVGTALTFVASSVLGKDEAKQDSAQTFDSGILGNKAESDASLPVVYGERRMGGNRVLLRSTGSKNEYLHIVLAICHGPISAINTVYLDDVESTDSKFDGLVTITKYLGGDDQTADSTLVSEVDEWTTDHRLRGVAYIYARIKYDGDVFSSLPVITADIEGMANIYDPRDLSTGYSNNPALCTRNYCTNTRYGRGIPEANFHDSHVIAEANHCDALVTKGGESATRYTCNGAVDTAQSMLENTKALLSSFRGALVFSGGQYKLRSDRIGTSSFSLTEDNVNIEGITLKLNSLTNTFNRVEAKFFNPDEDSQWDYAPWDDEDAREDDNGRTLKATTELKFTKDYYTALQIATLTGKASRLQAAMELVAQPEGISCEVFDVIDVTLDQYGFDEKLFRVMEIGIRENGLVALSLLEYDDGAHDFGTIAFKAARARITLPDFSIVAAPTGLTLESGTGVLYTRGDGTIASRIKVSWTEPADIFVTSGGYVEIQYKLSSVETWEFAGQVNGAITQAYINDVQDGEEYDIRIRSINSAGYSSDWLSESEYEVVGKTQSPNDVAGLTVQQNGDVVTFSWPQVSDLDLSGYEIRYAAQGEYTWGGATVLTSTTKGTRITTAAVPPGDWTFGIKARDTSGNYSNNSHDTNADITNANDLAMEVDSYPTWPGTLTDCLIHPVSRKLVPLSQSTASELGWEVFDEFVPDPVDSFSYEPSEIDLGFDSTPRLYSEMIAGLGYGESGAADPKFYLKTKESGGTYPDYKEWSVAYTSCRYIQAKFEMETGTGDGFFSEAITVVDLPERTESSGGTVTIAAGGTNIVFDQQFHGTPNIILTAKGTDSIIPKYTNESSTGFTFHMIDPSTSSSVGGEGAWQVVGA